MTHDDHGSEDPDATPHRTHTPSTRRRGATTPGRVEPSPVPDNADGVKSTETEAALRNRPWRRAANGAALDPDRPFKPVKPSFRVAPITIGLLLFMGAVEVFLTITDGPNVGYGQFRLQVFDVLAFSPIKTWATLAGAYGIEGLYGLVGHMLLHGGLLHFGLNALAMLLFGPTVERDAGAKNYALLFLVAGIGGALGHGLWQYGVMLLYPSYGQTPLFVELVGASGAISGLLGAELYRRAGVIRAAPPELRRVSPTRYLWNASSGFLIVNVLISAIGSFISGSAHIGGFVAGMAFAAAIGLGSAPPPNQTR